MHPQVRYLQHLFYELLNDFGRVYLVVKHSENTVIGNRGFTEEEQSRGLVLVFTEKNHRDLFWFDDGSVSVTIGFGVTNQPEKCFISEDDLVAVYSTDAAVKFERWDMTERPAAEGPEEELAGKEEEEKEPEAEGEESATIVSLEEYRKHRKN